MAIQIQAPDNSIVEFPDGTPDATITAVMAKTYPPKQTVSAAQQRANADAAKRAANTPGLVRALNNGFAFNAAGNLDALGAAAETGIHNAYAHATGQPDSGYGMGEAFNAVRGAEANASNAFATAHPVQSIAANLVGASVNPLNRAAGNYVAGAGSLGSAVARSAATGAALGAAYGAGGTQPGQSMVQNAGQGAAVGAVTGGALPVAGRVASVAGRAFNNATGQRLMGPVAAAASRLRQALQADGVDAGTIDSAVSEYQRTGAMPPSLADVAGENTRALLRYAGSRPGAARNAAQAYRDTTVEAVPDASIGRARDLTPGNNNTATQTAADLEQSQGTAATTDYAPAYAAQVPIDDAARAALSDAPGRAALQRALRAAVARQDDQQVVELQGLLRAGTPVPAEPVPPSRLSGLSSVKNATSLNTPEVAPQTHPWPDTVSGATLDRIQIALREQAGRLRRNGGNDIASGLMDRRAAVNSTLDNAPGLTEARANFASHSNAIDAVNDIGPTVLSAAPDDFAASVAGMDERGLNATRVGARQALTDALGQRANASPVLRQIAFAPNAQRNLTALFGEDEAQRFIQAARLNLRKANTANFVAPNTNSQTYSRGEDAKTFGNLFQMIRDPVRAVLEKFANGLTMTDREAHELVRMGISSPADAMRALGRGRGPTAVNALGAHAAAAIPAGAAANVNLLVRPQEAN